MDTSPLHTRGLADRSNKLIGELCRNLLEAKERMKRIVDKNHKMRKVPEFEKGLAKNSNPINRIH